MDAVDAQFLHDFQTGILPFEQWTHAAHIRMAYLVCRLSASFEEALASVREGIQNFNGLHASKLTVGFHETMTQFWSTLVWNASGKYRSSSSNAQLFLDQNPSLINSSTWKEYYTPTVMFSLDAKQHFVPPDLKANPINIS